MPPSRPVAEQPAPLGSGAIPPVRAPLAAAVKRATVAPAACSAASTRYPAAGRRTAMRLARRPARINGAASGAHCARSFRAERVLRRAFASSSRTARYGSDMVDIPCKHRGMDIRSRACGLAVVTTLLARGAIAGPSIDVALAGSEPGVSLTVRPDDQAVPEIPCGGRCQVTLPPGHYTIGVTDPEGHRSSQGLSVLGAGGARGSASARDGITLTGPTALQIAPPSYSSKVVGSVLLGGGIGLVSLATLALPVIVFQRLMLGFTCEDPCDEPPPRGVVTAGLVAAGAGLLLAVPGLILVLSSRDPSIDVRPLSPGWRVVPEASPTSAGLVLRATF
jgi:hypothetical protein